MKTFIGKLNMIGWLLLVSSIAMGAKIGDDTLRVGTKTGADIEIQMGNGVLKWDDGTSKIQLSNDGGSIFNDISAVTISEPSLLENAGSATSAAANALTINLKGSDGSTDPTVSGPVRAAFRSTTAADGNYVIQSATAALSLVVPSGATLGHTSGDDGFIYVYLLDNAGVIELAVSSAIQDESGLQTTTAIDTSSDDNGFYSTVARASVPIRLLTRLKSNQVTAGTWALDVIQNAPTSPVVSSVVVDLAAKMRAPDSSGYSLQQATINQTGADSIVDEDGAWLDSLTDNATGDTTLNITTAIFAVAPKCYVTPQSTSADRNCTTEVSSATVVRVRCAIASTGAAVESLFAITCIAE